ncbi:glutathione-dependent formaldehyde dehydrogenase [Nodosilinea sp. LEGE 06152]|uniref:zinc-dependent alcohol dehydrogenase n=1 Tax=Nodosilinea sp. LEGE 06152 TaxID=2777966 RepID=UPI00187E80AC|nr:zinc-dependent alcohol dehydrogenase [Nodosilinea sp. LEGE 06152]MBE9157612.1 glutathione-dependent formaldehyde dehydrogenase [Nodosilinea sp. LEGE 06152]
MKAVCWHGSQDVRVDTVPDPKILNPHDAILKVTSTAICGSDLHLYDGYIPTMKSGDILGHEFMGEVVETGPEVTNLKKGDRVVVPFTISCGNCFFCNRDLWSLCDNTNPNAWMSEKLYGHSPAGLFGYSHLLGGYAGGQAEYVRVPFANVGPLKVPDGLTDEQVLFLTDIFPTGYMAAENCDIQPGEVVAVWGCGPVGQFAIRSAMMLGAERVIAIDRLPERLALAAAAGAEIINYEEMDAGIALKEMTGGLGPDCCIDAVGMEAHGTGAMALYDTVMQAVRMETGRAMVLRQAIVACRKGGKISVPGVYGGFIDKMPMGAFVNKALTMRSGQTHVHKYLRPLLERIQQGDIDPSFLITHKLPLEEAPRAYKIFRDKEEDCIKVVLKPFETASSLPAAVAT